MLESLSLGVPCLISGNVGAKDLVKELDGGFVVENPGCLKEEITRILINPSLISEKQNKLLNFKPTFDNESFLSVYKDMVGEK